MKKSERLSGTSSASWRKSAGLGVQRRFRKAVSSSKLRRLVGDFA